MGPAILLPFSSLFSAYPLSDMAPSTTNNCTELGLSSNSSSYNAGNCTGVDTNSVDVTTIIIGVAVPVGLAIVIFIIVGIVVGIGHFVVQLRKENSGNGDPTVDSDNSAYIFMEGCRAPVGAQKDRHKPSDTSEGYVEVTEHTTLQSQAQDYEVPRSSSRGSEETDSQHQYENRSSWVDGQPSAYENHVVTGRQSQEDKRKGLPRKKAQDYENQEIITAQSQSLERLDYLSASYVAPPPFSPSEAQPNTKGKAPKPQGHVYINTPLKKKKPNKIADKHTYLTIVQ